MVIFVLKPGIVSKFGLSMDVMSDFGWDGTVKSRKKYCVDSWPSIFSPIIQYYRYEIFWLGGYEYSLTSV